MVNPSYLDTALHYCVDDLPAATVPGARLQTILESLRLGQPLTRLALEHLRRQRLEALHRHANGELNYDAFRETAFAEQIVRIEAAAAVMAARAADESARDEAVQAEMRLAQEQAAAARRARESDPAYVAQLKNQRLRERYAIKSFVEPKIFGRLMKLVQEADAGQRIAAADFAWLSSVAEAYFSDELRHAYYRLEARHYTDEYKRTGNPWMAVSASKHLRKCNGAKEADALLRGIDVGQQEPRKLQSAICTTYGGVMRDLERLGDALRLGMEAHTFTPDSYRPCTLLGAVHMESGEYTLGQEWYAKAVERGAKVEDVDQDLRSVFFRATPAKQLEMSQFLLGANPVRFAWAQPRKATRKPLPRS